MWYRLTKSSGEEKVWVVVFLPSTFAEFEDFRQLTGKQEKKKEITDFLVVTQVFVWWKLKSHNGEEVKCVS